MLQSYEAFYDHGRLTWTGRVPKLVQGRVMVLVGSEQEAAEPSDSGEEVASGTQLESVGSAAIGEFAGPLASLRARVATQYGDLQPMRRDELHPNGTRLAAILTEMAEEGIGEIFGDPMEWQREVRRDRPLPGREEE
jgi:hypothetical protein